MLSTRAKIKLARALSFSILFGRRILRRPAEVTATRRGITWRLDLKEGVDLSIYLLGGFEIRTIRRYQELLRKDDVVLDIGANIGAHTLPLAQIVGPAGKVYSFEPTAYAYAKQLANISLNPQLAPRIDAHQMMLMASDASPLPDTVYSSWPLEVADDLHRDHLGRLMGTQGASGGTLDQFIQSRGLDRVDFIKIDVDGNELAVLKGARATINRFKPRIIVELAPYVHSDNPQFFDDLLSELIGASYKFYDMNNGRLLPQNFEELKQAIPEKGGLNVLAAPNPEKTR